MITAEELARIEEACRDLQVSSDDVRLLLAEIESLRAQRNSANIENNVLRVKLKKAIGALLAGGAYSNALRKYQSDGVFGTMVDATPKLDALFRDWHDKTHEALAELEPK